MTVGGLSARAFERSPAGQVTTRLGELPPDLLDAMIAGRGRVFQRLEFLGDAVLELVIHAHAALAGPSCPYCGGRADHFTTDANLTVIARKFKLGSWLDWPASDHRLADLVEASVGAVWCAGRWPQTVRLVGGHIHPLSEADQHHILHGGAQINPEAPARAREILGAAILEAAATINAFESRPAGDEGELSWRKARLLSSEYVMSLCRDSKWVHRQLRSRHFVRDDVERELADELLSRGVATAVGIALALTR